MLVGRAREMARVAELLDGARQGRSGALVLRGDPGVGKSALLGWAREQAAGFLVFSARGTQSEVELAYAGLADLFRPVLDRLDVLPPRQTAALASALAIADAPAGERFAVASATLAMLDAASESPPLLAVVDDAHWLDAASAEALLFAARRVEAEGAVLLFAARRDDGSFAAHGLDELPVGGLDRQHTAELLAGEQLGGVEPLPDPLPAGASAERAFGRRVAALDPPARQALLAAAALGPDEDAASQLEAAAERAQQRSGFAAAAAALQRAAALSPREADRLLAAEAAAIRTVQPDQAARMLAEAAMAAFLAGEVAESLAMTVQAQETVAGGGGVAELVTKLVTGTALFHAGQPADGVRLLVAAADLAATADPGSLDVEYVILTALALMWVGELRRAEAILGPVLDEARRAGALGILPFALYASSYLDLRVGRLATAAISGAEAARLARDTGDVLFAFLAAGSLAL